LIHYRSFLNSDSPQIAEVWRGQSSLRAVARAITPAMLEEHVFSKLYFDRRGLIVAEEGNNLVGFVHAGFLPNDDRSALLTERGVINLLMTLPHADRRTVGDELLQRAEQFLRAEGATSIDAGCADPLGPYYLGWYGGSQLPGVLADDECWREVVAGSGYVESQQQLIFQCDLSRFRPPVDRQMMQIRRQCQWHAELDPPARSWWEACTTGNLPRTRFSLTSNTDATLQAEATFWNIEPLASQWGMHAMGLLELGSSDNAKQQGWEAFLLAESLREFQKEGVTLVEIHVASDDLTRLELVQKLGFEEIDRGIVYREALKARVTASGT